MLESNGQRKFLANSDPKFKSQIKNVESEIWNTRSESLFMKLVVLGSGSTVPHPRRSSSAYWLETSGGSILLDCSATASMRLAHEKLDWPNLDAIWISHFHLDHCGGLAPLLVGIKHASEMKGRTKPLRIFGPPGIVELVDRFSDVHDYRLLELEFPVQVFAFDELEKYSILPGVEALTMSTPHTDESHAIHICDQSGKTFVFTSDTGFTETLSPLIQNADLLLMECTFVKNKPVAKHLELAEAMYLIRKTKPKCVVLTHFYPEWDDIDFDAEVGKFDPGCEVIEATDGLRIDVL